MKKVIRILIIVAAVCCMACSWPFGLIRRQEAYSSGGTDPYGQTPGLTTGSYAKQSFIAQGDLLQKISFSFAPLTEEALGLSVNVSLTDEAENELWRKTYSSETLLAENYCTVEENTKLQKGNKYALCFDISGDAGGELYLLTVPNADNGAKGQNGLVVNDVAVDGNIYNSFVYSQPMNWKNVLFQWAFIWILAGFTLEIIKRGVKNPANRSDIVNEE